MSKAHAPWCERPREWVNLKSSVRGMDDGPCRCDNDPRSGQERRVEGRRFGGVVRMSSDPVAYHVRETGEWLPCRRATFVDRRVTPDRRA